jgi:hypothetical protein
VLSNNGYSGVIALHSIAEFEQTAVFHDPQLIRVVKKQQSLLSLAYCVFFIIINILKGY